MPILGSRGAASVKAFGFGGGAADLFLTATGGTISTDGNFKIHTFTSSATFEVTQEYTNPADYPVLVLVVAGGGGGGDGGGNGGAGGAGGYLEGSFTNFTAGSYPASIGNGGNTNRNGNSNGQAGSNTTFKGTTATGGGSGGAAGSAGAGAGAAGSGGATSSSASMMFPSSDALRATAAAVIELGEGGLLTQPHVDLLCDGIGELSARPRPRRSNEAARF